MSGQRHIESIAEIGGYLRHIGDVARLTREEEHTLALAWRDHGHADARERLINANLRLVVMVARRYAGRGVPLDELIAEGNVGLIKAVDNYDPCAGVRVGTYAVYWIQGAITELFSKQSSFANVSAGVRAEVRRCNQAAMLFAVENGREADDRELATRLDWQPGKVRQVRELAGKHRRSGDSLEMEIQATENSATAVSKEDEGQVEALLSQLSDRERRVIELQFGLNHHKPCSASQVARITQTSPRIARMQFENAMRKLSRAAIRSLA